MFICSTLLYKHKAQQNKTKQKISHHRNSISQHKFNIKQIIVKSLTLNITIHKWCIFNRKILTSSNISDLCRHKQILHTPNIVHLQLARHNSKQVSLYLNIYAYQMQQTLSNCDLSDIYCTKAINSLSIRMYLLHVKILFKTTTTTTSIHMLFTQTKNGKNRFMLKKI